MAQAGVSLDVLYRDYWGLIRFMVRRSGVIEVDDVASELFCRFVESGALADYDPDRLHETPSGLKRARFSTYLASFCEKTLRGFRDRNRLRASREHSLDTMPERVSDGGLVEAESRLHAAWVREQLARVPEWGRCLACWRRNAERPPQCCDTPMPAYSLARAWDWVQEDFERTGVISLSALASRMRGPAVPHGVSGTTAGVLLRRLREELVDLGVAPVAAT